MFFDWGHARGSGKPADMALLRARQVRGSIATSGATRPRRLEGVETLTQTCPTTTRRPVGRTSRPTGRASIPVRCASSPPRPADPAVDGRRPGISKASTRSPAEATRAQRPPPTTRTGPRPTASRGDRRRLHADGLADRDRRPRHHRRAGNTELAARLWDVAPDGNKRSSRAPATGRRGDGPPGVPAASERLALRGRPRGQARAAGNDEPYGRMSNFPFTIRSRTSTSACRSTRSRGRRSRS